MRFRFTSTSVRRGADEISFHFNLYAKGRRWEFVSLKPLCEEGPMGVRFTSTSVRRGADEISFHFNLYAKRI